MPEQSSGDYRERLYAPLRWWVQATMLLLALWYAFVVSLPMWVAVAVTSAIGAVVVGVMLWSSSALVTVAGGRLLAGRAQIPVDLLGEPEPLDAEATRRVHGVEADARAYLMMRPYLKRSVRVPVVDAADPTPYWLVSTRRPDRLVAAIAAAQHAGERPAGDTA